MEVGVQVSELKQVCLYRDGAGWQCSKHSEVECVCVCVVAGI